jgi:hypothetical protein
MAKKASPHFTKQATFAVLLAFRSARTEKYACGAQSAQTAKIVFA